MPVGGTEQVAAYLASLPEPFQSAIARLRSQIVAAAPKAVEGFGYGLPGFYLDGPLFYYGASKKHCALYGTPPAGFAKALQEFDCSKGTIRFSVDKPLSAGLVRQLVKAKAAENRGRAEAKVKGKRKSAQPKRKSKR